MKIIKDEVKFYLLKADDSKLSYNKLKSKYGNIIEPFDIQETNTQGYILPLDNNLIISFRGTLQTQDWFTDFNGFQIKYPEYTIPNPVSEIKVHQGFYQAYKSARPIIHESLIRLNPKKITICGHSLGGALATLCAVDIQYNFPNINLEVYTYGQPKVGNKAFEESFNKRVTNMIRTYMRKDIVPMCPPEWIEKLAGGKYFHVGTPNPIGPRLFMFGLFNWTFKINKEKFIENLVNHSVDLYLKFS